ncbi:ATP-dependent helicase, partial [Mesorhizobium sp. M4B.F.Ca.ET.089.01.1.1]
LHLVMPQRFFVHGQAARGDRHVYAARTRFIPASLLSAFEQTSWASVQAKDDPRRRPEVKVDLGARMRGMWK